MSDLRGVVMVILVVGCGYGQHLRRHQHFKHLNGARPRRRRNRILRPLSINAHRLWEDIKIKFLTIIINNLHFESSLDNPPPPQVKILIFFLTGKLPVYPCSRSTGCSPCAASGNMGPPPRRYGNGWCSNHSGTWAREIWQMSREGRSRTSPCMACTVE
jgi:hypothetical protein